ncbi:cobalt-precorrin-5B (C(1))-methyltransferase CbiD [Muricomes intestini]|uniref:Cobalt-precorrin-5B C(1)-methyltransferase n=1 Tax=Muricomes intestini TaxID=1796634 RepID=A0A4R3K6B6_9FIRM|nr:cobalt-precorrin-5B (C(1))-methyltransferase CbiD [Muricomes intestini]TCS78320.1 cobalt-precorrin 5B C1-methyltransferase [Muricomes intestini]HAX51707.1 cobalamin biosynthesis protein CbiD [Lachnospiraceae bacterium]HCR84641.1 cobalamin biosynthesis protein CbiD [Lachnospiraceae bacterium]
MQGGHVWKNQKQLRLGYTTGSCAAAAAKAAAYMLLSGQTLTQVSLLTPKGITLYLDVEYIEKSQGQVSCAIQKDSGDDPDITDGVYVYATVKHSAGTGLSLGGGEGVGRVTKKGLEQEIGAAAINKVPRHMILEAVEEQRAQFDCKEGLEILISIPEGQKLAVKTFNPRLGIEGGISVLGTSGIVEPMSEKALTDTIYLEMKFLKENGHDWCYIVPGNYGSDFLTETLGYNGALAVKCSNYIGETIDAAVSLGMKGILFIGHAGKLIKLAAGVMNTHSRQADCRMEVLSSHAAMKGASGAEVERIMNCTTTTEAIEFLKELGILDIAMESIVSRIDFYLKQRAGSELKIGAIMFSKEEGILCETSDTEKLLEQIGKEKL